ncbi:hypothetical protein QF037_001992 [Streptomyces canus]|nr:L,D-transpeptidase [Streptomyces canus]MDQ0597647.1 hypothetical protein [Streptomyces canus]
MGVSHISDRSDQPFERWSRRGVLTVLGMVPAAVLTGCGGSADASEGAKPSASAKVAATKKPVVSVSPADGTRTAGFGDPVEVTVTDVPHAQRLTTSGTFVHGNYWASASVFGSRNTSHGCIGLHDAKGADDSSVAGYKFYESSMLGDVVIVRNSGERTVDPANGLNGWNLSWEDWKAGSAR